MRQTAALLRSRPTRYIPGFDIPEILPDNNSFVINCDGGYNRYEGIGSVGIVIQNRVTKETFELFDTDSSTGSSVQELKAVIMALEVLPEGASITVRSDCKQLVDHVNKKMEYMRKGTRTGKLRTYIIHKELWGQLEKFLHTRKISFSWVRGHNGDPGNVRADQLATKSQKQYLKSGSGFGFASNLALA